MKKILTEKLSPEIIKRAEEIKKEIIRTRRDKLVKKYGANAGKILQGLAIKQAKKEKETNPEVDSDQKLKEMIQTALSKPLEEKLKPSMGAGSYVKDFNKSKAPQFKGKSKKKKQKMAVAAYLSAKDKIVEAVLARIKQK